MRTTLTLDEDVAAKLKAETKESGRSFKETVNEILRLGLEDARRHNSKERKPFKVRAFLTGMRPEFADIECAWELIERAEGLGWR